MPPEIKNLYEYILLCNELFTRDNELKYKKIALRKTFKTLEKLCIDTLDEIDKNPKGPESMVFKGLNTFNFIDFVMTKFWNKVVENSEKKAIG